MFNLKNKIYSNNNNLLIEIINDLNQLMNYYRDNLSIKILSNVINKINYIINENKKNLQLLTNDITLIYNQMNKRFDELKINNKINNQEIKYKDGRYIGEVVNGIAEGKGIFYGYNGDRYEGEWRNGKEEGKGIYYNANNGDRYEGEWRNGNREGKGICYFKNGDRMMGDYLNGNPIGKHVILTRNFEVKIENF